jgi:hypothetical protein
VGWEEQIKGFSDPKSVFKRLIGTLRLCRKGKQRRELGVHGLQSRYPWSVQWSHGLLPQFFSARGSGEVIAIYP